MKDRIKPIVVLTIVLSMLLFTVPSFAWDYSGSGSKKDPITSVDFTGEDNFEEWAEGKYFSYDCVFKNLTADNNKTFRLLPVYDSVKSISIDATPGKFGSDKVKTVDVNFNDDTITAGKEIIEQDENKNLSSVLSNLGTPTYENYFPYFYEFDESKANKRLFFDSSDPEKKLETDKSIDDDGIRYDDMNSSSIYVVWKDNKNASSWSEETLKKASMIGFLTGYDKAAYIEKFGGDENLPYGTFSAKKELPGAKNLKYNWTLKKGGETKQEKSEQTYTQENIGKELDGAILKETISYGPIDAESKLPIYSLTAYDITYTVYSRPAVSAAAIE